MKGKFRILGHIGIGVLLVCALMLAFMPAVPVAAATAVTDVWVEFPFTDDINANSDTDSSNIYIIHFKPTTALERGVDSVTVNFPDGSAAMGGDGTTSYAFTVSTLAAADVLFSTDYDTTDLINGASWKRTTTTPTVGGKRAQVRLPIDIAAGQDVWVKFDDNDNGGAIVSAATEDSTYKVYVSTTKDTTPVLSSTFAIGDSGVTLTDMDTSYPVPTTAGSVAEYIVMFTPTANVTATSGKVTLKFPVGTTLPSSISATNVQFNTAAGAYSPCSETPTVDVNRRMITAIPSITLTGGAVARIKILVAAGITNPTIADASNYKVAVRTNADGHWDVADNAYAITYGSGTKVIVANGEIGTATERYSDNATMINMYSSMIWVALADQYGNGVTPASATTLHLSSSSTTGTFAYNADATGTGAFTTGVTSTIIDTSDGYDPNANPTTQVFYYKDSTAGTHTLTFSATGYTSATWTFTVCPGISVYDASNNLINTYAPLSTESISETAATSYTQYYSGDYINSAIAGAMAGDTVKLGDGSVTVNVQNPQGVAVFEDSSTITVEAGAVASRNFTYTLPADAVAGQYLITAKVYDAEESLLDETTATFTVSSTDCSWLDETPKSGTVSAGGSDSITVTIDTTGLAEGSYSAEIVIASNDSDEASTTVPVTLQVSPAEPEVTVSIDAPDEVDPDSDFTANVNISEVVNFDACNYDISFDASVLRLDDVTSGLIDSTPIPVDVANEVSPGTWTVVQNVSGLAGASGSGYLAVLHFYVTGSGGDTSPISLSNGMLANNLAEEIVATWVGDSVNITSMLPGDANGDGNINAIDITKVERIISGLDTGTPGADANQDGNINALDITKIELIIGGLS
jgi:hypothetical protein